MRGPQAGGRQHNAEAGSAGQTMGNTTSERPGTLGAKPEGQQREAGTSGASDAMGDTTIRQDDRREPGDLAEACGCGRCGNDASGGTGEAVGNPDSTGPQERTRQRGEGIQGTHADGGEESGGQVESEVGRDFDGPASWMDYAVLQVSTDNRTDELRLLGNGVVPATAERAFRTLIQRFQP